MSNPYSSNLSIFADPETIVAMMSKLSSNWDEGAIPSPSQMRQSVGTAEGVTYTFRREVGITAAMLAGLLGEIRETLETSKEQITAAVKQLADRDASLADEAAVILETINSLPPVPVADGATTTTTSTNTSFR